MYSMIVEVKPSFIAVDAEGFSSSVTRKKLVFGLVMRRKEDAN